MTWLMVSVIIWIALGLWGANIFDRTYAKIAAAHGGRAQEHKVSSEQSEVIVLYLAGALLGPIILVASLYNASYSCESKAEEKSKAGKCSCTKNGCGCSREEH